MIPAAVARIVRKARKARRPAPVSQPAPPGPMARRIAADMLSRPNPFSLVKSGRQKPGSSGTAYAAPAPIQTNAPTSSNAQTSVRRVMGMKQPIEDLPHVGPAGVEFICASLNPNRNQAAIKDVAPKFPDGSADTATLVCTWNIQYPGSTLQDWIVHFPSLTGAPKLCISGGTSPEAPTNTPTATATYACNETTLCSAILTDLGCLVRVVAAGIKCNFVGGVTHEAGKLRAGHVSTIFNPQTAAATWRAYAQCSNCIDPETFSLTDGIEASMPFGDQNKEFHQVEANTYTNAVDWGKMPLVQVTGMENNAGALVSITATLYLEYRAFRRTLPFPITPPAGEQDLAALIAFVNGHARIASGKSLMNVFRMLGSGIRTGFKIVNGAVQVGRLLSEMR